jgi:hypothetical protein
MPSNHTCCALWFSWFFLFGDGAEVLEKPPQAAAGLQKSTVIMRA